jgi:hypothetical protein
MKVNITKQNNEKLRMSKGEGEGENDREEEEEEEEGEEEERRNKNIWKFDCDDNEDNNQNDGENENERGSGYVSKSDNMRRQSNRGYQGNIGVGVGGDEGEMISVSLNERYVMSFCMIQSTIQCNSHTIFIVLYLSSLIPSYNGVLQLSVYFIMP